MPLINWIIQKFKKRSSAYGSARWMTRKEKRKKINSKLDGFVINGTERISRQDSFDHLLCAAPSGSGKSTIIVVPNLMVLRKCGIVCIDPSGELHKLTHRVLEKDGMEVKCLDFRNPQNSLCYNPFHRIETSDDISKVAGIIVDSTYPQASKDPFWTISAKDLFMVCINALIKMPDDKRTLNELYRLIIKFNSNRDEVDKIMMQTLPDDIFEEYLSIINEPENTLGGILKTAKSCLAGIASNSKLCEITKEETLNFESLRKTQGCLFLILPEEETHYRPLVSMLLAQIWDFAMKMPENDKNSLDLFFLLDEFPVLKPGSFKDVVQVLRKRRAGLAVICQDINQIYSIYGQHDGKSIISGGLNSKIFFPGLSFDTCDEVSRLLGNQTIIHKEKSFENMQGYSKTRPKEISRPLITPDELRTLNNDRLLFIQSRKHGVILKRTPWYKNPKLIKRIKSANNG